MILKIALMSYSFIPSKCFLPGGQLNFQSGINKKMLKNSKNTIKAIDLLHISRKIEHCDARAVSSVGRAPDF